MENTYYVLNTSIHYAVDRDEEHLCARCCTGVRPQGLRHSVLALMVPAFSLVGK